MRLDAMLTRLSLLEASRPSVGFCEQHRINFAAVAAECGGIFLAEVEPKGRRFEPRTGGILVAWVDVFAANAEDVTDTVAWPIEQPGHWWTLTGAAPALGESAGRNPATYALGGVLQLYRQPLTWLQAGCRGAVLLDFDAGARWLIDLDAPRIAVEDRKHAADIAAAMDRLVGRERFLIPEAA